MTLVRPLFLCSNSVTVTVLVLLLFLPTAQGGELRPVNSKVKAGVLDLHDLAGQSHRLIDYRGKLVLVNFWASWCRPCVAELPGMSRLKSAMRGRDFEVIAVNMNESKATAWKFSSLLHLDFITLLDLNGNVSNNWGVELLPTSFIIDAEGYIRYRVQGELNWDKRENRAVVDLLLPP